MCQRSTFDVASDLTWGPPLPSFARPVLAFLQIWEGKMPKAYLVAHIRVHDKEAFEKFKAMSALQSLTTVAECSSGTLRPTTVRVT